ncbi:MAG: hypothetical protein D6695_05945 [Planctomycetota bacterium]|nr:MAG: hypothetical protein D6695_05945 [Planctomycetota bacterium]
MRWKLAIIGGLALGILAALGVAQSASRQLVSSDESKPKDPPQPVIGAMPPDIDARTGFAAHAFPPTIPDQAWHHEAWIREDCLSCHETGVQDAPIVRHRGLPALALQAKCRSCHVLVPGKTEARPASARPPEVNDQFAPEAFPPMMPNNDRHVGAWTNRQCLVCHETGVGRAPLVDHGPQIPRLALMANCRSCHVQVRSTETSPWDR